MALTVLLGIAVVTALVANVLPRVPARILTVLLVGFVAAALILTANEQDPPSASLPALVIALGVFGGGPLVLIAYEGAFRMDVQSGLGHLPGSAWIGAAERLVIVLALMLGLGEVAAVVLGVKALGQYATTTNTESAHRVFGTLVSTAWALACFAIAYLASPAH